MIASSWLDPVLGIDLHWEMVPTPAPVPLPFPHPFIGIVVDVGGLVGSVVMSGVMSAVFGAPFQGPVPRTPKPKIHPGKTVVPAPPVKPENDAVAIFGSKTVLIGGSNAVRLGDLQPSCSEPIAAALEHFEKDAGFRADILAKATEGRLSVLDFAATYEKNGKLTLRDLDNGRSWEMRRIEQNIKKMQETEGGGCT